MKTSSCGLQCSDCSFLGNECQGCFNVKGMTFWASSYSENGVCPLFECAINRKRFKNCGDCLELPCDLFLKFKDPELPEELHQEALNMRIERLKIRD